MLDLPGPLDVPSLSEQVEKTIETSIIPIVADGLENIYASAWQPMRKSLIIFLVAVLQTLNLPRATARPPTQDYLPANTEQTSSPVDTSPKTKPEKTLTPKVHSSRRFEDFFNNVILISNGYFGYAGAAYGLDYWMNGSVIGISEGVMYKWFMLSGFFDRYYFTSPEYFADHEILSAGLEPGVGFVFKNGGTFRGWLQVGYGFQRDIPIIGDVKQQGIIHFAGGVYLGALWGWQERVKSDAIGLGLRGFLYGGISGVELCLYLGLPVEKLFNSFK